MWFRRSPGPPRDAAGFYATRHGQNAAALLAERLRPILPSAGGRRILGLGYAAPVLARWPGIESALWAATARLDTPLTRRPPPPGSPEAPLRDCIACADSLPFDDLSLDIVVLVHGLEFAGHTRLLRAIWKALADDGCVIFIVPNRTGFWAHDESTPFGHGQPYSAGQLNRLLARTLFRQTAARSALAVPPFGMRLGRRASRWLDRAGCLLGRHFGGVHLVIACKDLYAGVPLAAEGASVHMPRRVMDVGVS